MAVKEFYNQNPILYCTKTLNQTYLLNNNCVGQIILSLGQHFKLNQDFKSTLVRDGIDPGNKSSNFF
jgi:hypothetical protein